MSALDYYVGWRICESLHLGVLRPSRRLRRVSECNGLLGWRDIMVCYSCGRVAPLEALAPSECLHWIIMWAGDYLNLCI